MIKKYLLLLILSLSALYSSYGQCPTPTTLTVSSITATTANLSWASGGGETQWEVFLATANAAAPTPNNTGIPCNTNPYVLTGLTPCTAYKFYVRAVCSPGVTSAWSTAHTFSTMGTPNCTYSANIVATQDIPTSSLFVEVFAGSPPYSFQWSHNGTAIQGATGQSLAITGQSGTFQVTVTDSANQTTTATITIQAPTLTASNDAITIYPNSTGISTSTTSVLANDSIYDTAILPNYINQVTITPLTLPSGFSINANGTISVLPGTAPGTYTLTYKVCSIPSPNACSNTAAVTVTIANEGFLLNAFLDTNNNGTQDSGELNFNLGTFQYQLNNGTINTAASTNGTYYIQESNAANSYNFSFLVNSNYSAYYSVSPSAYNNVTFTPGSGVTILNFPVTQLPYADAVIVVSPYGAPPRPGFTYKNIIYYTNNGNQAVASGTLTFTKPNAVSITAVSQAGTTPTATGFTYDFTNLQPNETRSIIVTMQVPTIPTVNLNDLLTSNGTLSNISNDVNPNNNTYNLTQIIVGSYDPNDKTESHGGKIVHSTFTSNDYLTYTIQFENTGTYYAENVRINDVLDAKLDETSVKMVNASHPFLLTRTGTTLNWNFNGIDLLPAGKGQVTFQIKPKPGYTIGDIIPNTASIYFDFNPAIVTNTYTTEFVATMSVSDFNHNSFVAYPNPTKGLLTIASKNTASLQTVTVTDVTGKTVLKNNCSATEATVDVSHLMSGIYFLTVESNEQKSTVKFVKQ
ncbi:DUF7619 domain-containing protein [Flavobacterium pedocola]